MKVYSIQTAYKGAPKLVYAEVPDTVSFSPQAAIAHRLTDLFRDLKQAEEEMKRIEEQIFMTKLLTATDAQPKN